MTAATRVACAISMVCFIMSITGCAVKPKPQAAAPAGMSLDEAIKEAAVRIDERVEAGTKIALLNFNSPAQKFSLYVLDELTANLLDSRKLTVVDRKELYLIRDEFTFQLSGDVEDNSMQELGRMLGAQSIVSGSLTEIGGSYRIVIRVLSVQSAAVVAQYRTDIVSDKRVTALLERRDGGRASGGPPRRHSPPAPSYTPAPAPAAASVSAPAPSYTPAPAPAVASVPAPAPSYTPAPAPAAASVSTPAPSYTPAPAPAPAAASVSTPAPSYTPAPAPAPAAASVSTPAPSYTSAPAPVSAYTPSKPAEAEYKPAPVKTVFVPVPVPVPAVAPAPAAPPAPAVTSAPAAPPKPRKHAASTQKPAAAPAAVPAPTPAPVSTPAPKTMTKILSAQGKAVAAAAAKASISFMTLPAKADVYVGGKLVGTSNTGELQVPSGTHQVRFVKGSIDKTVTFTFEPGKNEAKFVPLK